MAAPVHWGSEFLVMSSQSDVRAPHSKVIALKNGGFVAVWSNSPSEHDEQSVKARLFNAEGHPLGGEFTIAANAYQPDVTVLSDGRIAITYLKDSAEGPTSSATSQTRLYNADGFAIGGPIEFPLQPNGFYTHPAIVALSNGGFVVALSESGDDAAVWVQAYHSNGTVNGATYAASQTGEGNQFLVTSLTALADGRFSIGYDAFNVERFASTASGHIYGRILTPGIDPSVNATDLPMPNPSSGVNHLEPHVEPLSDGRVLVAWYEKGEEGPGSIRLKIGGNGREVAIPDAARFEENGYAKSFDVVALRDGGFAVAWYKEAQPGDGDLFVSVFSNTGDRIGTDLRVDAMTSRSQSSPVLTELADGRLMVAWSDREPASVPPFAADTTDFRARIVDPRVSAISREGSAFDDHYFGTAFNDTFEGSAGADRLDGGLGFDFVSFANSSAGVTASLTGGSGGDAAGDIYTSIEGLIGSSFDDVFTGNGAAVLRGGAGNDTYYVSVGDVVEEAANGGRDTVIVGGSYSLSAGAEVEVLRLSGVSSKTSAHLTGSDTANEIHGHAGANTLRGMGGNDVLKAGSGNDRVYGDAGNDTLYGGAGNDRLYGGKGKDIIVFDTKPNKKTNVDRIYDFNPKDDTIWLDNAVFTKLGKGTLSKPVKFKSDMFVKGKAAKDREDRIVYDNKTGALYYDQDGTGSKAQVKIATLNKNLKLTHSDFFVI